LPRIPGFYRQSPDDTFYFKRDSDDGQRHCHKEDIDAGCNLGLNHPMGPLVLADLIGLDTVYFITNAMYAELKDPQFVAPPLLARCNGRMAGTQDRQGFYDYK